MNVSRRFFLGGALALGATAVVRPQLLPDLPTIVGDGIHDDTRGLNALFARCRVNLLGDAVHVHKYGDRLQLIGGHFRITDTVVVPDLGPVTLQNVTIDMTNPTARCAMHFLNRKETEWTQPHDLRHISIFRAA